MNNITKPCALCGADPLGRKPGNTFRCSSTKGDCVLAGVSLPRRKWNALNTAIAEAMGVGDSLLDQAGLDIESKDAELAALRERVEELEIQKDGAYTERDALVAALSKCFPSYLGRHPDGETWDDDWRWIVFIDLPTGQASWHIHDSEVENFDHLGRGDDPWDGHTTEEKYARLAALSPKGEA